MGNTQCQCIATHQNQKFQQIYHPRIEQKINSEKRKPHQVVDVQNHHFDLFPTDNRPKQQLQSQQRSQSKVSIFNLSQPSQQLQQKQGIFTANSQQNHIDSKKNLPPGQKKQSSLSHNNLMRKQTKHLQVIRTSDLANMYVIQQKSSNTSETTRKQTLRQRVSRRNDINHKKSTTLQTQEQYQRLQKAQTNTNQGCPLQLQHCAQDQSKVSTKDDNNFSLYSTQKGISLRQQYQLRKMIQRNMCNLKQKVELWDFIMNNNKHLQQQLGFYSKYLFDLTKLKKQNVYKIVVERHGTNSHQKIQQNQSQQVVRMTKFYRGNIKRIQIQSKKNGQNKPFNRVQCTCEGVGQEYCVTGNNSSQFTYYKGFYRNNKFQGKGLFVHSDNDYYLGQWKNSQANGRGTYQHFQGMRYSGSWKNDYQHGDGEEYWQDGAIFKGKFYKGKKTFGQFKWPNGSSFIGQFKQNRLQGKGKFTYQDDRYYYGQWKDNMMQGYGQFKWKNGQVFKGQYHLDKKHGQGLLTLSDGTAIQANWDNGKIHGKGKVTKSTGQARVVQWNMGVQIKQKKDKDNT